MKGSIFKSVARNGRTTWRYQIFAGLDENGKQIRLGASGFKLEREASDAMREAMKEQPPGRAKAPRTLTLGGFLKTWLPYHAKAKPLAPKTAERYESLAAHATRMLGDVPLRDLSVFQFDDAYVKLRESGLSPKTVREVHNVVHVAMKRAVKTKLIPFNPADGCELPRRDEKEAVCLNPEQLEAYERKAAGTWVDLLIRLAGAIGARRGELLATRWSDLNWSSGEIRIERSLFQVKGKLGLKPTKTRTARLVTVPASLLEYLKLHREQQEQTRAMFGPDYRIDLDLIFADPAGNFLLPSSVTRAAVRLAKKAGLSGIGLHSLRHTHASGLLAAGVPITNVAKRLGHRDAYTTARVYAHALPNSDAAVAATWDKLREEKNGSAQKCTNPGAETVVKQ